jgi:uncharacterized RDD family membrane protein YckC
MAAEKKHTAPTALKQPFSEEVVESVTLRQTDAADRSIVLTETKERTDLSEEHTVPSEPTYSAEEDSRQIEETASRSPHPSDDSDGKSDKKLNSPITESKSEGRPRSLPSARFRNAQGLATAQQTVASQISDIKYATLWSRFVANLFDSCVAGAIGAIVLMLVIYIAPTNTIEPIFGGSYFSEMGPALLIYCFILSAASWSVPLIVPCLWFACMSSTMPEYLLPEGMSAWTTTIWLGFLTLAMIVPQTIYSACLESSSRRATLGKRLLGILVCNDDDKSQISFQSAVDRYLFKAGSFVTLLTGFLVAWDSPRRLCLHDRMSGTVVLEGHSTEDGLTTDPKHLLKLSKQQQFVSGLIFLSLLVGLFRLTFHEAIEEQSIRMTALLQERLPNKQAAVQAWLDVYWHQAAHGKWQDAELAIQQAINLSKTQFAADSPQYVSELLHIGMTNFLAANHFASDHKGPDFANRRRQTFSAFNEALSVLQRHPEMTISAECLTVSIGDPTWPQKPFDTFGIPATASLSPSDVRLLYARILSESSSWMQGMSQLSQVAEQHPGNDPWWKQKFSHGNARAIEFARTLNKCSFYLCLDADERAQEKIKLRRLALLKPIKSVLKPWNLNEIR